MISSTGSLNIHYLSTLPRYTNFTNIKTGFDPDIIERLVPEIKLKEIKDHEGNCSMLLNKMKGKSGLVFSRATKKKIVFTLITEIKDELLEFERKF